MGKEITRYVYRFNELRTETKKNAFCEYMNRVNSCDGQLHGVRWEALNILAKSGIVGEFTLDYETYGVSDYMRMDGVFTYGTDTIECLGGNFSVVGGELTDEFIELYKDIMVKLLHYETKAFRERHSVDAVVDDMMTGHWFYSDGVEHIGEMGWSSKLV